MSRRSQVDGDRGGHHLEQPQLRLQRGGPPDDDAPPEGARLACAGGGTSLDDARAPALDRPAPRARRPVRGVDHVQRAVGSRARAARLPGPAWDQRAAPREDPHGAAAGFRCPGRGHRSSSGTRSSKRCTAPSTRTVWSATTRRPRCGSWSPKFRLGESYDTRTSCNRADLDGILKWIRGATKQADWLIYSTHCHESGNTGELHEVHRPTPPEFLVEFRPLDDRPGLPRLHRAWAAHPPGDRDLQGPGRSSTASATSSSTTTPCSGSRIRRIGARGSGEQHAG